MRNALLVFVTLTLAACERDNSGTGNDADASTTDTDASRDPTDSSTDSPMTPDPATDGPSSVDSMVVSIPGAAANRTLASTVFVPSSSAPHALVVISPGFQMTRTQYASYARHLATWGFVVILTDYAESGFSIDHQRIANDVPAVITWALGRSDLAIDSERIATAGHSLGGKVSILAATGDARIKAVVAWDPVDSNAPSVAPEKMGALTAAVAVIGETTNASGGFMPCAPAADNFTQFYAAAPSPALQATVAGADHMDWVDDPSCFACTLCGAGTASADVARTATKRLDVAWLRKQLFADASFDSWLASTSTVAVASH